MCGRFHYWCGDADAAGCCVDAYIRLYFGPLPPSRGVQRGPSTSVALQSTQLGAFTRSRPSTSSYTPAAPTRVENSATYAGTSRPTTSWLGIVSQVVLPDSNHPS